MQGSTEIISAFNRLWYEDQRAWKRTNWLGVPSQQCPTDLWTYQEIISDTRPDTIVEVGVKRGGTTLYLASVMDALGHGRVVGVDLELIADPLTVAHPRVTLIQGDSLAPNVFDQVQRLCGGSTLVLLDSNHAAEHVLNELRLYAPLIQPGGYIIVNDTNINGHPSLEGWGEGPWEAVEHFLAETDDFESDGRREIHMLTQSPRGFLRRR